MGRREFNEIRAEQVEDYLRRSGHPDAELESLHPLGQDTDDSLKGYGYGKPLQVNFRSGGESRVVVIRSMAPDPFGHARRSDRAEQMILSYETFSQIPKHIQPLDVGGFDLDGRMHSLPRGEFFLVADYVEGELYANNLHRLVGKPNAPAEDLDRTRALARYLAEVHSEPRTAAMYTRHLRDTVGGGEGIFGLCDTYPRDNTVASPARLVEIEQAAMRWRWRLAETPERSKRTHGDFHPFNILFREGTDFSVLDCSRGAAGDAADDIACLSINYLFFSLAEHGRFEGALRQLWDAFWGSYLEISGDWQILRAAPLYFAWRSLVVASPVWYPDISDETRDRMLRFAERGLTSDALDLSKIDDMLR